MKRKISCLKILLWGVLGISGLCLALSLVSAAMNQGMPTHSSVVDHLSTGDKARLAEAYHLREEFGDDVLPGWSQADIPVILYNEEYAFLVRSTVPPDGWKKAPQGQQRGSRWEVSPDDTFQGQPYYRQRLPAGGPGPENFTVRIGDQWAASMMTLDWFKIDMANTFRDMLPAPLKPVFPYPMAVSLFLGGGDQYLVGILHESAHAYQGMKAPDKLADAEIGSGNFFERYPWEDEAWAAELDTLRDSVKAASDEQARTLARKFLMLRAFRRQAADLSADLIKYEQAREWEEGLGKYAEMSMYRLAATTPGYAPVPEMIGQPDFHLYRGFQQRWNNEVNQISLSRSQNDIRFYYTGFAQAVLLDRLMPGWKAHLFEPNMWLEDLLAQAVQ